MHDVPAALLLRATDKEHGGEKDALYGAALAVGTDTKLLPDGDVDFVVFGVIGLPDYAGFEFVATDALGVVAHNGDVPLLGFGLFIGERYAYGVVGFGNRRYLQGLRRTYLFIFFHNLY